MIATAVFSPLACDSNGIDNGGTPPGDDNGAIPPDDNDDVTPPDDTDGGTPGDTDDGVPVWVWVAVGVGPLLVLILGIYMGRNLTRSKAKPYDSEGGKPHDSG